jgi:hypothetical protein
MLLQPNRSLLLGVFCAALAIVGCSARKPIVSADPSFHLVSLHGDSLVFTPAMPANQTSDSPVRLTFASGGLHASIGANCSAERGPFRIEPAKSDPSSVEIVLPAPERWLSDLEGRTDPDSTEQVQALDALLADADRLQQDGCFAVASGSIRDFILQSVPMRPTESFYNAYGYRIGRRGLDLKPGIRLKIERAYFRAAKSGEGEYDSSLFLGLSTTFFDVEWTSENKTRFQQVGGSQYSPGSLAHEVEQGNRDLAVGSLPQEPHYRLFFYSYLVPQKHQRSAVIMGADSASQLDELDRQLRALPAKSCESAANAAACLEFEGFVTLSSQIRVEINGKIQFLDWGAAVKDVLPKNRGMKTLKSLKIQRRYMNSYRDLSFDPKDSKILSLGLVGGDRLAWSNKASFSTPPPTLQ